MFFDSLIIDIPPLQRGRYHRAGNGHWDRPLWRLLEQVELRTEMVQAKQ